MAEFLAPNTGCPHYVSSTNLGAQEGDIGVGWLQRLCKVILWAFGEEYPRAFLRKLQYGVLECGVSSDKLLHGEACGCSCWLSWLSEGPGDVSCWDEPRLTLKTSHRKSAASSSHFSRLSKALHWKVGPQNISGESQLVHNLYMRLKPWTFHVLLHSVLAGSCDLFCFFSHCWSYDTHLFFFFFCTRSSSHRHPWESGVTISDRKQTHCIFHSLAAPWGGSRREACFLFVGWSPLGDNFRPRTLASHRFMVKFTESGEVSPGVSGIWSDPKDLYPQVSVEAHNLISTLCSADSLSFLPPLLLVLQMEDKIGEEEELVLSLWQQGCHCQIASNHFRFCLLGSTIAS